MDEEPSKDHAKDHEPDVDKLSIFEYVAPTCPIVDYFSASLALLNQSHPTVPWPLHMFATPTTIFHLALKPSSWLTIAEAALK